jgi:hypothetical protein
VQPIDPLPNTHATHIAAMKMEMKPCIRTPTSPSQYTKKKEKHTQNKNHST